MHVTPTALRVFPAAVLLALLLAPSTLAQDDVLFIIGNQVGVGTSAPSQALHVVADAPQILVESDSLTSSPRTLFQLTNLGRTLFNLDNQAAPATDRSWYFVVSNAGRFAIGRAGSGMDEFQVLQNGDTIIGGSLTTAGGNYPDYVFAPDYPLMPLAQLEEFIDEHRHLPNVPTAEEVDGGARVNMSELQLRLLEKVEELTLYTLEQERVIARQAEALAALEGRLGALEAEDGKPSERR